MLPSYRPGTVGSSPEVSKYVVRSSDVLEDLRVCVLEEGSDKVSWYKERFLTDNEIVENVVENATSTLCWTIHRPKRGWYIKLRAPSFRPGVFIGLSPVPSTSAFHVDAALSFSCRTAHSPPATIPPIYIRSPPDTAKSSLETVTTDSTAVHSYPPTPPTPKVIVQPPSPRSVHAKLDELEPPMKRRQIQAATISDFILAPYSAPHIPQVESASFFSRALAVFKNNKPSHSSSFTLSALPSAPPPLGSSSSSSSGSQTSPSSATPLRPQSHESLIPATDASFTPLTPLVTFHDQTPVWTVRSNTGLIEIDVRLEREMGVDRSFWIAMTLAYMGFLGDRESYLAAAGG